MKFPRNIFLLLPLIFLLTATQAQQVDVNRNLSYTVDSLPLKQGWKYSELNRFPVKQLLVPTTMIAYGFITLNDHELRELNVEVKDELYVENPHAQIHIDNYLQFVPAVAVYGLNAIGIKGRNNFRDRTMIYLLSNTITNTAVYSIKKLSHQMRPDGSAYTSFPSGHTAEAFLSAEFLYQEYKDVSPWYGVAGYAVAATTGYLRLYNNKHWLGDIVAGAGIGIASTKIVYWIYPRLQRLIFKNRTVNTVVMPSYKDVAFAVGLLHRF